MVRGRGGEAKTTVEEKISHCKHEGGRTEMKKKLNPR